MFCWSSSDRAGGSVAAAPDVAVPSTLEELLPRLIETDRGLCPADLDGVPTLTVPIGLIDKPFEQRRDPMWLDLATAHFLVAGGPQSGKSTVLRTLVSSLSLTHTPEQLQFYCLDFGGGTLTGLGDLPHVGSVATRLEPQRVRRTIAEINGLLERREQLFTQYRVDSMASYRRLSTTGQVPYDGFGDVFLVVDGWGTIRSDFEEMEQQITQIAARGLGFGVHIALSIQRWMEIRPALRDLISSRLELRLGDPTESHVDRRAAANVPTGSPGRGLSPNKLHFLAALPRIDCDPSTDNLVEGVAAMVKRVASAWSGPPAPDVRLLPADLPIVSLPPIDLRTAAVPIGIDENTLSPVLVDFDAEPHFIVIGDVESGKSNLQRVIARGVTTRYTPKDAKIITFDYRRGLLGAVTTPHQIGYVMTSAAARDMVNNISGALRERRTARLARDAAVASRPRPTRASANRRDADPDRTHDLTAGVSRRSRRQAAHPASQPAPDGAGRAAAGGSSRERSSPDGCVRDKRRTPRANPRLTARAASPWARPSELRRVRPAAVR